MLLRISSLFIVCTILILSGCVTVGEPNPMAVANAGEPSTVIVVAEDAPLPTLHAAEELQHWLNEITASGVQISHDMTLPRRQGTIILGRNEASERLLRDMEWETLGNEEYLLRSAGRHLLIVGGEPRGTLYGVYGLLEDHLNCRWFTPAISRVPRNLDLQLPVLDERVKPVLEYREPFTLDVFDGDWAARNRMNGYHLRLEEKHGGEISYHGFVHTFESLVPPAEFFDSHPEYFSLVNGQRLKERSQLCCTNEDVVRIITERVTQRMREHPEATVFSISQNDWYNYCECDKCQAVATAEDSQIGPVLQLVNSVSRTVAQEFPDKAIDTLAYQWTRKPPKTTRPEPNVIVRLCSIECCFSHPFTQCDHEDNKAFVQDVEGWSKMCDRLWVWDYVTSFANYYTPFPNLHVRAPNIRFFVDNNVTGIFEQDVYNTLNGELSPLSGYLNAKLLWDPTRDPNKVITEFLEGVYGSAAPALREYLHMMQDEVVVKNIHMKIWEGPDAKFLDGNILLRANGYFQDAERLVADQPELLERVRVARMTVDYASIERLRQQVDTSFTVDHAAFAVKPQPKFEEHARRFLEVASRSGVTNLRENGMPFEKYKAGLEPLLAPRTLEPMPAKLPARRAKRMKPGLTFSLYTGDFVEIPDFASLTPISSGTSDKVTEDIGLAHRIFALNFAGNFLAPADGVYTFSLASNDGSQLWLGDALVVDNGGAHGNTRKSGHLALRAGLHPIRVGYFQMGAGHQLELSMSGPNLVEQEVSGAMLWH